jgi:hypothetical protein
MLALLLFLAEALARLEEIMGQGKGRQRCFFK